MSDTTNGTTTRTPMPGWRFTPAGWHASLHPGRFVICWYAETGVLRMDTATGRTWRYAGQSWEEVADPRPPTNVIGSGPMAQSLTTTELGELEQRFNMMLAGEP